MRKLGHLVFLGWAVALLGLTATSARAQQGGLWSFSYGGRLASDQDVALPGPVDLQIKFYRTASGGTPLPVTVITKTNVALDDGVFQIDVSELTAEEMHDVFSATATTWIEVTDLTHTQT